MASYVSQVVGDAQTGITSLGGAIAGSAADRLGDTVVGMAGLGGQGSLGDVGLSFIVRTLASSAVYGAAVALMPETSENILFTLLYFQANRKLVSEGLTIANAVTSGFQQSLLKTSPAPIGPQPPGRAFSAKKCSSGGCA